MTIIVHARRFLLTGGALTIVGYVAIVLLTTLFKLNPYIANISVYSAGVVVSYWLNAKIVFKDHLRIKSFIWFLCSFAVSYFANIATLIFSLKVLNLDVWISQLFAVMAYSSAHFLIGRTYVFQWGEK